MTQTYDRDQLVARLVRAGELEVSGEHPDEVRDYFAPGFEFHGPGDFESDYEGLQELLRVATCRVRGPVDPARDHRRRGQHDRLPDMDRGDLRPGVHPVTGRATATERSAGRLGPIQHLHLR